MIDSSNKASVSSSPAKTISIVIPVYNEEDVLDELIRRLKAIMDLCDRYRFEAIMVENGSHDSSFEKLMTAHVEDPRFKVLQLSRNFGCDGGIAAGLQYVKGDAAVIMNADLQDPPEMIPLFIAEWEDGFEIVYGVIQKREGVSFVRRVLSSLAYKLIFFLTNKTMPKNASDFRLIDRKVCLVVNRMKEKDKYLRGVIAWTGFKQRGIPFERPPRFAGETKAGMRTALKVALNGIFSFSYVPLHLATLTGFAVSLFTFALIIAELWLYLMYGRIVPGFTTTIVLMLFLFGALFAFLGILGVYVGRIYEEVKQRPDYIVRQAIGFE
jgi:glycosyltransferase involved in cell wall biosynthesis